MDNCCRAGGARPSERDVPPLGHWGSSPGHVDHIDVTRPPERVEEVPPGTGVDRYPVGVLALTNKHALEDFVNEAASPLISTPCTP